MTNRQVNNTFSQDDNPVEVQDGTLPLTEMPKPGVIGLNEQKNLTSSKLLLTDEIREFEQLVRCLSSLEHEMRTQTQLAIETACNDRHSQTSYMGVRFIQEDRADAFGHCWIACRGSKSCGASGTQLLGEGREMFREAMSYITLGWWGHNSFVEDVYNQAIGRELARISPDSDCSQVSYEALVNGLLHFHGRTTSNDSSRSRVYNCTNIILEGHEYQRGWRLMPKQYLSSLRY